MDNIQANEKTVKEFVAFLDNDLHFISENLELMNKQLNDELEKIVLGFTAYLDKDFKFVKDNLSNLNGELNKAFKETFENKIKQYPYFKEHRFSPLVKHTEILLKPTQETANTKLLTLFLKQYEFKNYLLKSLLFLIEDKYKNKDNLTIKDAESEVPIKNGRIDVLCTCNENIDGKNQIVIEAKIGQREQDKQTMNYYKAKENEAFKFIYLTKETQMPQCNHFKNITWLDLTAAFYAGYNSYKFSKTDKENWYAVNFSEIEDSNEGIFFQMWLSNILTHLYHIEDIEQFNDNDYNMFIISARFMEKYKEVMEAINGK